MIGIRSLTAILLSSAILAIGLDARAQDPSADGTTIARWIQLARGSTVKTTRAGSWGDQPLRLFPTVLARAIITGGACPVARLGGLLPVPLHRRFDASTLTRLPGTPGSTNGKTGYPQYFVLNPDNTAVYEIKTGSQNGGLSANQAIVYPHLVNVPGSVTSFDPRVAEFGFSPGLPFLLFRWTSSSSKDLERSAYL